MKDVATVRSIWLDAIASASGELVSSAEEMADRADTLLELLRQLKLTETNKVI